MTASHRRKRPMLNGQELSNEQLAQLKAQVESFDTIEVIGDDMRELIEAGVAGACVEAAAEDG
jgi:hypothetical protein